ncbi:hypothetical protein WA026_023292 [Henosepilachna vigintioctopunctata]|uniref:Protein LLP homolog n=1 Tax=Henosepilachna vigintioctopunctata TaxID=420089 RepID=A0AAW1TY28_9CUCU
MAKSLRSKWRRKCRAVKRVRYGKKELERLKSILPCEGVTAKTEKSEETTISDIANLKTIEEITEQRSDNNGSMEIDSTVDMPPKFNAKTLRDKNGAYPVWLHPRKYPKKGKKQKNKANKKKERSRK